jgi:hypothetical protein
MTDNIRKLITDCSTVTHGGVPATTEHTRLAKVAEMFLQCLGNIADGRPIVDIEDHPLIYASANQLEHYAMNTLQEAERIAGDV